MDEKHDSKPSPNGATRTESDQALALAWATLGDLYGPLWASGYGSTPTAAWRATLAGLSLEEVRTGLRATAESGEHYPPGAPEFRARCRPGTTEQRAFNARLARDDQQRAALPSPEGLAGRTGPGRQWLAYWWLRDIRPRPRGVTMDQIDAMLDGADVERMDAQVAEGRRDILGSMAP